MTTQAGPKHNRRRLSDTSNAEGDGAQSKRYGCDGRAVRQRVAGEAEGGAAIEGAERAADGCTRARRGLSSVPASSAMTRSSATREAATRTIEMRSESRSVEADFVATQLLVGACSSRSIFLPFCPAGMGDERARRRPSAQPESPHHRSGAAGHCRQRQVHRAAVTTTTEIGSASRMGAPLTGHFGSLCYN